MSELVKTYVTAFKTAASQRIGYFICKTLRITYVFLLNILMNLLSKRYFENCALLGYYAESSGKFLPTFQDNLSVQFSRVRILGCLTP